MKTRVISGVLGSLLVATMLILGQFFSIIYSILVAVVSTLCVSEVFVAGEIIKKIWLYIPSAFFAFACPIIINTHYIMPLTFIYLFVMFVVMVVFCKEVTFDKIAFSILTTLIIVFGLGCAVLLCNRNQNQSLYYIMLSLVIPWLADSGAYFAGNLFGKHKLCPEVSPKKTVEGAIGGLVVGVLGAIVFSLIFDNFVFTHGEKTLYFPLIIMAILGVIVSIFGDLSFSMIKRSCHIKDYGSIIPGHGGILDRCDSLIFTIPFVFLFTEYFHILAL